MVKKKELKNMAKEDLEKNMLDLRMELIKANAQRASGTTPKNPGQIKHARKTIARILTFIKQREVKNPEGTKKK
jgi:large subunit ribosomal protein L29